MNDFLDSTQRSMDIETYYQKFLMLIKYAPIGMTQEIKVARFVSGLQSPLKERLQALRLTTFTDVLEAGKPIEKELSTTASKRKIESTPIVSRSEEGPKASHQLFQRILLLLT